MPDINNPQAIKFTNEMARVYADSMVTAYETAKRMIAHYDANNIAAVIPDTADSILDGAATDGRQIVQANMVRRIDANARAVVAWFEGVAVGDTATRIARFRQLAVNGAPRF